jgi:hypothetical protein
MMTPLLLFVRKTQTIYPAKFQEQLSRTVWSDLLGYNDPHNAYGSFVTSFSEVLIQRFQIVFG